ncbi:MAG: hypothetical protein HY717_17465 [Planctomycetes bacterium]|nr:hypothetical protein [Planctomycetota bacterium]
MTRLTPTTLWRFSMVTSLALTSWLLLPLRARAGEAEGGSFASLGTLGKKLKDNDFYELTYLKKDGAKAVKKTALVQIPEGTAVHQEHLGRVQDFKEGDKLQLYGKPEEREVPGKSGIAGGVDRIIKGTQIVVAGGEIKVNKDYKDPKDKGFKWCDVEVEKSSGSLKVKFEGQTYTLTLDKKTPIVVSAKVEKPAKLLKTGVKVIIKGSSTDKPATEDKKAPEEAYKASTVIIVAPNLAAYHDSFLSI